MKYLENTFDADTIQVPKGKIYIARDRCKGCGYCIKYCPKGVLEVSNEFNAKGYYFPCVRNEDACLNCGLCEVICPEFAIWSTLEGYVKAKLTKVVGYE